jgi:hypothetical protein
MQLAGKDSFLQLPGIEKIYEHLDTKGEGGLFDAQNAFANHIATRQASLLMPPSASAGTRPQPSPQKNDQKAALYDALKTCPECSASEIIRPGSVDWRSMKNPIIDIFARAGIGPVAALAQIIGSMTSQVRSTWTYKSKSQGKFYLLQEFQQHSFIHSLIKRLHQNKPLRE